MLVLVEEAAVGGQGAAHVAGRADGVAHFMQRVENCDQCGNAALVIAVWSVVAPSTAVRAAVPSRRSVLTTAGSLFDCGYAPAADRLRQRSEAKAAETRGSAEAAATKVRDQTEHDLMRLASKLRLINMWSSIWPLP